MSRKSVIEALQSSKSKMSSQQISELIDTRKSCVDRVLAGFRKDGFIRYREVTSPGPGAKTKYEYWL